MTDNDKPADDLDVSVDFDAPAVFRKWPSLSNERSVVGAMQQRYTFNLNERSH